MTINKTQAIFYSVMCALGAAGWVWVFIDLYSKGIIGSMFFWVAFGCIFLVCMIGASIEFIKTLIQYRKYNQTLKYGNVKAGDCISASRLIK